MIQLHDAITSTFPQGNEWAAQALELLSDELEPTTPVHAVVEGWMRRGTGPHAQLVDTLFVLTDQRLGLGRIDEVPGERRWVHLRDVVAVDAIDDALPLETIELELADGLVVGLGWPDAFVDVVISVLQAVADGAADGAAGLPPELTGASPVASDPGGLEAMAPSAWVERDVPSAPSASAGERKVVAALGFFNEPVPAPVPLLGNRPGPAPAPAAPAPTSFVPPAAPADPADLTTFAPPLPTATPAPLAPPAAAPPSSFTPTPPAAVSRATPQPGASPTDLWTSFDRQHDLEPLGPEPFGSEPFEPFGTDSFEPATAEPGPFTLEEDLLLSAPVGSSVASQPPAPPLGSSSTIASPVAPWLVPGRSWPDPLRGVLYLGGHPAHPRKRKNGSMVFSPEGLSVSGTGFQNWDMNIDWAYVDQIDIQGPDEVLFGDDIKIDSTSSALIVQMEDGTRMFFEIRTRRPPSLRAGLAPVLLMVGDIRTHRANATA